VLDTHIVEIIMPLFFFAPFRSLRIFAGIRVHVLMFIIALTGNYNFFNLLTMVINMVNFDDEFLLYWIPHSVFRFLNIEVKEQKKKVDETNWNSLFIYPPIALMIAMTAWFEYKIISLDKTISDLFSIDDLTDFLEHEEYCKRILTCILAFIMAVLVIE
jgi:hypothetical protein